MTARFDYREQAPETANALYAIGKWLRASSLPAQLRELLELRVSQMNGCAFCCDLHAAAARTAGVSEQRLERLAAWREDSCFSEAERAALGWAETLTALPAASDELDARHRALARHFDEEAITALSVTVTLINAWNRLVLASGHEPPARAR